MQPGARFGANAFALEESVEHLWSPWRMEYILSAKDKGCVFCQKVTSGRDDVEHILLRGQTAYVTLNRYPYNNGHLLIVPYVHAPSLENLTPETLQELMVLVNRSLTVLRATMRPEGFNIGANLGKVAGAGIESHVHLHVVPRWRGDTNFMTTVADTRTVPETLDQTFARLRAGLAALAHPETVKATQEEITSV